jgi:hypothetical protein
MKKSAYMVFVAILSILCNNALADSVHVNELITTSVFELQLDADVEIPAVDVKLYETDYADITLDKMTEFFGNGEHKAVQKDYEGYSVYRYDGEDVSVSYFPDEARIVVTYMEQDYTIGWTKAKTNEQAEGLTTTPEQAIDMAQKWVDEFTGAFGLEGYKLNTCYTMPPYVFEEEIKDGAINELGEPLTGCYIVEFDRQMDGIAVSRDISPYMYMETEFIADGDVLAVMVDDRGIVEIDGNCRNYVEKSTETIQIQFEDAMEIFRENMDYVACYPDMPCVIDEISLCYRLVQHLPEYDENTLVCTQVRPVWRFASDVGRLNRTDVYFLIIDAITGEVIS